MNGKIQRLALMSLCAALTVVGTYIRLPVPGLTMIFTAQVYVVLLTGLLLGPKDGFMAMLAYILLGLCGFPVFSKGGGLHTLATPEGGFLLGFLASTLVCGFLRSTGIVRQTLAALLGVLAMHAVALCYIAAQFALMGAPIGAAVLIQSYSLAFLPLDLLKGVGAALTVRALQRALPGMFGKRASAARRPVQP
ncbi:MAG TPA: biotin transporter BioY [Clostridia bacterium]|nr:biotin transporter BioY [Clostridia bacterium]